MGKIVREYRDNAQEIACLKKQLADVGGHLSLLGQHLQENPSSVMVNAQGIRVTQPNPYVLENMTTTITRDTMDPDRLQGMVSALSAALNVQARLRATLDGMGLNTLFKEA